MVFSFFIFYCISRCVIFIFVFNSRQQGQNGRASRSRFNDRGMSIIMFPAGQWMLPLQAIVAWILNCFTPIRLLARNYMLKKLFVFIFLLKLKVDGDQTINFIFFRKINFVRQRILPQQAIVAWIHCTVLHIYFNLEINFPKKYTIYFCWTARNYMLFNKLAI